MDPNTFTYARRSRLKPNRRSTQPIRRRETPPARMRLPARTNRGAANSTNESIPLMELRTTSMREAEGCNSTPTMVAPPSAAKIGTRSRSNRNNVPNTASSNMAQASTTAAEDGSSESEDRNRSTISSTPRISARAAPTGAAAYCQEREILVIGMVWPDTLVARTVP